MRCLFVLLTMALVPTVLSSSSIASDEALNSTTSSSYLLEGRWVDNYYNVELQIKRHRRGIRVKRSGRSWRTYTNVGRGVYEDFRGSSIVYLGRGEIRYNRGRSRPVYMARYNRYDRGAYDRGYNNRRADRYSYRDRYSGQWYCEDRGISLTIQAYGNGGIRARRGNDSWTYYDDYRDNRFFNAKGSGYYFENNALIWSSRDGRRKLRFRKR